MFKSGNGKNPTFIKKFDFFLLKSHFFISYLNKRILSETTYIQVADINFYSHFAK